MYHTVPHSLMARYIDSLFAVVCWCIHAAIALDKLQLWQYSKGTVTPHEGIASFGRGKMQLGGSLRKRRSAAMKLLLLFKTLCYHLKTNWSNKLSSCNYICHFHIVTCKADDIFQPSVGHSQHNLQTEVGLTHTYHK